MDSSQPGPSGTQGKTVHGGEVGVSHQAPMPGGHLTTQDTEVGVCHTAPMLGGQTPIRDTVDGVCHTAPMPGGYQLIPRPGLSFGKANPGHQAGELGNSQSVSVPSDLLPAQDTSIAVSHMTPMPSNQSHDPSTEAGVPLAPTPDGQSLPHSGLDLGKASTVSQLLCLVALISRALGLAMSLCLQ